MTYWLLKTEPDCYAFAELEREGRTVWDGVKNTVALKNIRAMAPGDQALIYHTGDERAAIGLAEVISSPYPDPQEGDPKLLVVDIKPLRRLHRPVTLAELKDEVAFAESPLLRQSRLSVIPLTEAQWHRILALSEAD